MTEIHEPEDSGSSGTQERGKEISSAINTESPLYGLPITRTVEGLAATNSRSLGGEVAANLIAGSFTQISHELQQTKNDLKQVRNELNETKDELTDNKINSAILYERVNSLTSGRHLHNLSITAGTVLISIGIEFYRNSFEKISFIISGLGSLLVLFGWLSHKKETK